MSFRTFTDSHGLEWSAWDVIPGRADRRIADRRLLAEPILSERRAQQRRLHPTGPSSLTSVLPRGWLCFETRTERRRLIPIPDDWPTCADERLEVYCLQARRVAVLGTAPPARPRV